MTQTFLHLYMLHEAVPLVVLALGRTIVVFPAQQSQHAEEQTELGEGQNECANAIVCW
jgi:hypothetical protein